MLEALEAPRGALVVMDRGVATEDRIQWLREEGYRYVVASRQGHRQFGTSLETASKARLQLHKEVQRTSASLLPFRKRNEVNETLWSRKRRGRSVAVTIEVHQRERRKATALTWKRQPRQG